MDTKSATDPYRLYAQMEDAATTAIVQAQAATPAAEPTRSVAAIEEVRAANPAAHTTL